MALRRILDQAPATFEDPAFLATLDVVFANLYFAALAAALDDVDAAPAAWRPLLLQRHDAGIARIQFALAGMSAHINRDLPEVSSAPSRSPAATRPRMIVGGATSTRSTTSSNGSSRR